MKPATPAVQRNESKFEVAFIDFCGEFERRNMQLARSRKLATYDSPYVVNAPNMQSRDRAASTFVQVRVTTGGSAVEWGHRLGG